MSLPGCEKEEYLYVDQDGHSANLSFVMLVKLGCDSKEVGFMAETEHPNSGLSRPLLGRILEEKFHLLESKLEEALAYQQEKGGRLGEVLLHLRSLREDQLLEALAQQFEMTWMPQLDTSQVDHELIKKVPIAFCRRYRVLPQAYFDKQRHPPQLLEPRI